RRARVELLLAAVRAGARQRAGGRDRCRGTAAEHRAAHHLRDQQAALQRRARRRRAALPRAHGRPLPDDDARRSERPAGAGRAGRDRGDGGALVIETKSFRSAVDAQGVATLSLDRPERINALTFEVYAELERTFRALSTDRDVRAVILRGEGERGFCSGGD